MVPVADRMTPEREQEIQERFESTGAVRASDVRALLAEVDRLRGALREACDYVAELEYDLGAATAESGDLKSRLNAASTVKCWTNEDGKRFVFANDLAEALGYKAGGA